MRNFISLSIFSFWVSLLTYANTDDPIKLAENAELIENNQTTPDNQSTLEDDELVFLLSIPDENILPDDSNYTTTSTQTTHTENPNISDDILIAQLLSESELLDTERPEQTILLPENIHAIPSSQAVQALEGQPIEEYIPVRKRIEDKTLALISCEQGHLLTQFNEISLKLQTIPFNANVHVLDPYVIDDEKKIQELSAISEALALDNPLLTLQEIGVQMIHFIDTHPEIFDDYQYEKDKPAPAKIKEYLSKHFDQMDQEIINKKCPHAQIIWSRAFSLALDLFKFENDLIAIKMLYDAAIEGHLTNGGCIEGRINRGFLLYTSLLGKNGLGDIQ